MPLTKYIALLRAVNLAGHNPVSMADLRTMIGDLGFANPRTVLQSGNVVFEARAQSSGRLEALLERETKSRLGLEIRFFVRTASEWQEIIHENPFEPEAEHDPARLLVLVARTAPPTSNLAALRAAITGRERVELGSRHVYAVYPDGVGRSKLTVDLIQKRLGTPVTGRNWNTVLKLDKA